MNAHNESTTSQEQLLHAIQNESQKFQEYYLWLENAMPQVFFDHVSQDNLMLIAHNLMGFHLQEYFSMIHLHRQAIVLCLDSADADLKILTNYSMFGIKNYQCYVSKTPPPFPGVTSNLRIAVIYFTEAGEAVDEPFPLESKQRLKAMLKEQNPTYSEEEFEKLISGINSRFLKSMPLERLILALNMFFRAKTRDSCQYEVRYDENWEEHGTASMQIVLAWKNTPKHNFLYRIARVIHRYQLVMKKVHATYIDPYEKESILIMTLDLHGSNGQSVWDVADIPEFLRELITIKYFASFDVIDDKLIDPNVISGNMGNYLRAATIFIHQCLLHLDSNLYTIDQIERDLCRHPELASMLCEAIHWKFNPDFQNYDKYLQVRDKFIKDVERLDTGNEESDTRRKNVLMQGMNFIHHTLKTNFYQNNKTALSYRLDPKYLDHIPFDRSKKFPILPYAVFFIKGMHFFGFHIRFKDLARGGLRTVFPELSEHIEQERNNIFTECYHLALTQHMKNKDIPEGGAKGIIFLKPYDRLESEARILQDELKEAKTDPVEIERKIEQFRREQKLESLYQVQRSFIESFLTLINCFPDGKLRARNVVDYWNRPEYIYLGPDENMHDVMIEWIANYSTRHGYKPGGCFISSKPKVGINHKEYGVTSLGVNVYMEACLKSMGIDPKTTAFTVKMSGGPDGDVAGNQIYNLYKYFPNTAKLVATTDVSGTIHDREGLNLKTLVQLFEQVRPIRFYPPENLSNGGFLVDKTSKRSQSSLSQQTLCWRKNHNKLTEEWLSGSEMNQLIRSNVHQTKADIFIPSGGRPRTLNRDNVEDYLDETGKPTSLAIVEGANLYLTPEARHFLEEKGTLIIKDSSANKTGVICSSFEVLCGLTLGDERFLENKPVLVKEILERLRQCAQNEADLLLRTHKETGRYLTDISNEISIKINQFTYQLLDYLDPLPLSNDPKDPLIQCFLSYCLPTLRTKFEADLMREIPEHHKKAIISCHLAARLVYHRGLNWHPTIIDVLPVLLGNNEKI